MLYLHGKTGTRTRLNITLCAYCLFCYCVYYFYTREFCVKIMLIGTKKYVSRTSVKACSLRSKMGVFMHLNMITIVIRKFQSLAVSLTTICFIFCSLWYLTKLWRTIYSPLFSVQKTLLNALRLCIRMYCLSICCHSF